MRKAAALVAAITAAVAAISLVPSAGARDIPVTLNLIAHTTHTTVVNNRYVATGSLVKASDPDHRKGHFRAVFNRHNRGRGVAYLHNGKIKVDNVNSGDSSVYRIIGGTRHWAGVTGTMRAHQLHNRSNTLLNFHVK
jgi:hypothetical protein